MPNIDGNLPSSDTGDIDSLLTLYVSELQELRSGEAQLQSLIQELPKYFESAPLEQVLHSYAKDLDARIAGLDQVIEKCGATVGEHIDSAMQALIRETNRMAQVRPIHVRGAALLASLQRLIHFVLSGYGTVATYADKLGRAEDAERFHGYVEREKEADEQLTALAKAMTNPEAQAQGRTRPQEA